MRYLETAIVLFFTLTLPMGLSSAQEWHIITVDSAYNVGNYSSLALDNLNYPHISYFDETNENLKYAYWTGSEWDIYTVDLAGHVGYFTSIALDNQQHPHISYYDWDNENLKYAHWTGTTWDIQIVDSEDLLGDFTSIAVDTQGYPHISYRDYRNRVLKYAYWTGTIWEIQTVDYTRGVGYYTSIALDSQDFPHISYQDHDNYDLKYAHWTGNEWEIQVLDCQWNVGFYTSIDIDSQDHPHISYYDTVPQYDLKYAQWTGSDWDIQIVDSEIWVGSYSSISLDSQDRPHISYLDLDNECSLKYAYWTGSTWDIQFVDFENWVADYTSIAIDSNDRPYISYFYSSGKDLKLAWYGYDLDLELTSFSAQTEDSAISINWTVDTTPPMAGGDQITGFNLYRREINNNIAAEVSNLGCIWTKVNTGLITGQNPYTYTDSDVEAGVAYEYKLEAVLADESPETLGTTQATAGLPPASFAILALYPNPASDMLTCLLAMPEVGIVELTLYDLSGRLVLEKRLEPTEPAELEAVFDVSGLASGVYTLRASYDGAEVSARAVIAR